MYKQIPEAVAQNKIELKNGHHHTNVLVHIAELFKYKSYLEIGINLSQECFDLIPCEIKIGVDPISNTNYEMLSREFWDNEMDNDNNIELPYTFDLIFIDGEHTKEESKNDLKEALKWLSPKGTIVLHDVNPWNEDAQKIPRVTQQWNGDVWKTAIEHVAFANHFVYTIDCDYGICCIHPFAPREQESNGITSEYGQFEQHKKHFLNLISIEEWYKKIKDISSLEQVDSSDKSSWKNWVKKDAK